MFAALLILLEVLFPLSGQILHSETKEPVPGAVIRIKGTAIAVASDRDGFFHMKQVQKGTVLIVSHVGFKTVESVVTSTPENNQPLVLFLTEATLESDVVTVTSVPFAHDRRSAPVPVQVTSAAVLNQVSAPSISEGLSYQPGLRVENNCSNCGFTQVRINGMEGAYTQIMVDGRPVVSALQSVYGLEQFPSGLVEQLEVIRSASAQYGGNAIAGTVNIVTRHLDEPGVSVEAGQGVRNRPGDESQLQLIYTAPRGNSPWEFQAAAYARYRAPWNANTSAVWTDADATLRNDDFTELTTLQQAALQFRARYNLKSGGKLDITSRYTNEFRRGGNRLDVAPHEADIAEQLRHNIGYTDVYFEQFLPDGKSRFGTWITGNIIYRDSYYGRERDPNAYGDTENMVGNTGFFLETMGALNTSWRAGGDFITEHIEDRFPKFNRIIQQTNRVFGTYVQGELPLRSRDRLMAGLRMDAHSALDKPVLNPRVNYLMAFSETLQLRAGVSRGFRAPVLFDEDLHIESVGGLQKRIQNKPGLAPERSTSWQLALEKEQANALSARFVRLGAFLTRLERNFQLEPIFSDENVFIFERRNGQGASVSGITLEAGFRLAGSWEMQAAWTIQQGRLRDGLAWSETAPTQTAMLRIPGQYGYALISRPAGKNLTLSGDVNITGPMRVPHYAGFIEEDRLVTSSWFFDAGLKAAWKPFTNLRSLTVEFSVRNLFNQFQRDQDAGINRDPGYIYGPLLPRTLYSTIRWTNF